jgi:predicted dehydrogenase
MRFGILGCGYVSDSYLITLNKHPDIYLVGCHDLDFGKSQSFSDFAGIKHFQTLPEMLADTQLDAVINLTNPRSHFDTTQACLRAGKHVYSEKPLGMNVAEAQELLAIAKKADVVLATAPCSVLSPSAQTLGQAIHDGVIGKVRLVYANFDDGMIAPFMQPWNWKNSLGVPWPAKDEFEVGCTFEHAGYFLSWLCTFFGSARSVASYAGCLIPDKGIRVEGMAPDFTSGVIEFENGVVARVTCGLVAPLDKSMTIVGDEGALFVRNLRDDLGEVWHIPRDLRGSYARLRNVLEKTRYALGAILPKELLEWLKYDGRRRIPLIGKCDPVPGYPEHKRADFLRGPAELAASVREKRPCRLPAELGVHMVEIINALQFPESGGSLMKTRL